MVTTPLAAGTVDYLSEVKPILSERCYSCHGALKQKGGLRLDTVELMRKGGKDGAVVNPGKPETSPLMIRVSTADMDERMPPEGNPLKPEQIEALRRWIAAGAASPANEHPESDPRDHWAFKAPARPALPRVKDSAWAANPIDAFVASARESSGLKPQPLAARSLWLRRVYLDLIGLPPSLEEIRAFTADKSPQAYEKVVDRLLASPQYGERWGRHWMDIWRYTDWYGLGAQLRNSQKHIWHWRDWIVESLNQDKGYDRMIMEMLAGDEIAPMDRDVLRATGYLARDYYLFNRTTWLDNTIEHTAKAFLGLTINCSKCHDHKYDPITQKDYYGWRAFFEPYQVRLDELPGQPDLEKDGLPRAFDLHLAEPTYLYIRGDEKNPDKSHPLAPAVPATLAFASLNIRPISLPLPAHNPAVQPFVHDDHRQQAENQVKTARDGLSKAQKKLAETTAKENAATTVTNAAELRLGVQVAEKVLRVAELRVVAITSAWRADVAKAETLAPENLKELTRAAVRAGAELKLAEAEEACVRAELEVASSDAKKKAEAEKKLPALKKAVETAQAALKEPGESYVSLTGSAKALEGPDETEAMRLAPFPDTSTGRRTALAEWIIDPRNPLPARVAVNHLWARHFGQPLVATMSDFGRRGALPTHPELLDWLAVELREHNWSMKHIHRLMVLSRTYRMDSSNAGAAAVDLKKDPENKLYWRMNPLRMEAQVLRDNLLSLSGQLDCTMGGPTIDPKMENQVFRRSLYFTHSPENPNAFLDTFDNASTVECYRRAESVLPQQALALANSKLSLVAAQKLADRMGQSVSSDDDFIRRAFETILAVPPTKAEQTACAQTLNALRADLTTRHYPGVTAKARADLVQALLNHNDFITIR